MFLTICRLFLYFILYSFTGWVCETIYCSAIERRFVNRGFLTGPLCPVYGFGALAVINLLSPLKDNIPLLFLAGMAVTTLLEYITAYLLERLFNMKWWDYSNFKLNLHGRVCLLNSLEFGVLSVAAVKLLHPLVIRWVDRLSPAAVVWIACILTAIILADCTVTVHTISQFNGRLKQLTALLEEVKDKTEGYKVLVQQGIAQRLEQLKEHEGERFTDAMEALERLKTRLDVLESKNRVLLRRLLAAFPHMTSVKHQPMLERVRLAIKKRKEKP